MRAIQTLKPETKNIEVAKQEVIAELFATTEIADFITRHSLPQEVLFNQANTFYEYQKALRVPPVNEQLEGYLFINDYGSVEFAYRYKKKFQKILELKKYIECLYLDEALLLAEMTDFQKQADAPSVLRSMKLVKDLREGKQPQKGLFVAGENGVGKTHMLLALAKEFAKREQKSIIVFVPEYVRFLKQNPYEANQMIQKLQNVPILFLDDIGAEMQTSFSRDEVLLPILNSRMNSKKLTFFSSNFALPDLELHFTKTQYGEHEPIKARRMLERIEALSYYVGLTGENQRKK